MVILKPFGIGWADRNTVRNITKILLALAFIIITAQAVVTSIFIISKNNFNKGTAKQVVRNRLILEDYIQKNDLRNLCEKSENFDKQICQDKEYPNELLKSNEENHFLNLKK